MITEMTQIQLFFLFNVYVNIHVYDTCVGCECLQKLDLTVNFVGRLSSVESLKQNMHLRELFLVGNPCNEFKGYRQYVLACLPQLQVLYTAQSGRETGFHSNFSSSRV